jgi:hypothetical protein
MSYNKPNFRRPTAPKDAVPDKYRAQVQSLQEMFPSWSNDGRSFSLACGAAPLTRPAL